METAFIPLIDDIIRVSNSDIAKTRKRVFTAISRKSLIDFKFNTKDIKIANFEYMKKSSKETGPALLGIELAKKEDLQPFLTRMDKNEISYTRITSSDLLYQYLI